MAEDEQAAPPPWLQQLGQTLNQQSQQIAALTQTVQRATAPQPQAPPRPAQLTTPVAEVRERILSGIVNEPERVLAEQHAFTKQETLKEVAQQLAFERQQMEQNYAQREFWRQFHAANPDMQGFQAEVWNAFNSLDPSITDPSARANAARDSVRSRIQQVVEMSQQQEKQAQEQRRLMAGAPGGAGLGPALDPVAEAADEYERTKDALQERRAFKAQNMAHNLRNDSEYHEARRQETLRKKGAEAQRRAG